jgi:hypothetical protein
MHGLHQNFDFPFPPLVLIFSWAIDIFPYDPHAVISRTTIDEKEKVENTEIFAKLNTNEKDE